MSYSLTTMAKSEPVEVIPCCGSNMANVVDTIPARNALSSMKGHKDDEGTGAPHIRGKAVRDRTA